MGQEQQNAGVPPQAGSGHSRAEPEEVSALRASVPNADWLRTNLTSAEVNAFLALFAGARSNLTCFVRGDTGKEDVSFGKAECEWVPFRETWQHKFPALGLTTFEESDPSPALGMVAGSTFTRVTVGVTDFGRAVREAFWARVNASAIEARRAETQGGSVHESAVPQDIAPNTAAQKDSPDV